MESSNINQMISLAGEALVDFSDSDLSGNIGERLPSIIPSANSPQNAGGSAPAKSGNYVGFNDDSLDSPDVPMPSLSQVRPPQDPIDSVSSADASRPARVVTQAPVRAPAQQPSAQPPVRAPAQAPTRPSISRPIPQDTRPTRPMPSRSQPNGQSGPQSRAPRMPIPQDVRKAMRNIATRHNMNPQAPRPTPTRVPGPQPQDHPQPPAPRTLVNNQGDYGNQGDQGGIIDPNRPADNMGANQASNPGNMPYPDPNGDPNAPAIPGALPLGEPGAPDAQGVPVGPDAAIAPVVPDHMTTLMGYSIPTTTLYLILVLVLIAVALYFWTAPPAKKEKNKKDKKNKKDDEDDDE